MTTSDANASSREEYAVARIATLLDRGGGLSMGDLASLRRMDPRQPAPAFFKLEGMALDEYLPGEAAAREALETRWAAVVVGLAHLGALHRLGHSYRLGYVLADLSYTEMRVERLLHADEDRLIDDLPALARYLTTKGAHVDWCGAANLLLSAGRSDGESHRRHIARDYYGRAARLASR